MIDGFHGSQKGATRIMAELAAQSSALKPYLNETQLRADIMQSTNCITVYN